ncbi:MAG: penicillin amidase [Alcanivorax sp.]|nr:penicillin amidase [Alcanivorax sp.]MAY10290.1 penicillin amidase [Alcanivorax sp.]MBI53708.1 penicillin amidase [Alcanivorax sp.]|tara:strand:- start:142429 stop:145560 length:3132 start_codon:yes stop_codon:yes gene_type:complete
MRLSNLLFGLFLVGLLTACGGGGGGSGGGGATPEPNEPGPEEPEQPQEPEEPTLPEDRPATVTAPYADYGRVLNVLPPGQDDNGGLSNLVADVPGVSDLISGVLDDLVAETGLVPALSKEPHFDDQLALYDALVRSPEGLTDNDLTGYFKPSPLSAPDAGAWESEITVTGEGRTVAIKRDDYGVPHIFGDSRADALFGVGYVTAADRLFLLDVLRRAGRGELSRFLGPADFSFDRDIAVNAPYREEDRTAQIANAVARFGDDGAQVYQDAVHYVEGLNNYVAKVQSGLLEAPIEYLGLGVQLEPFVIEDVVAIATLIQGIFAGGGGDEQANVLLLQALRQETGSDQAACDLWRDLRHATDPESTVTTDRSFATQSPPAIDRDLCPLSGELAGRFPGAVMFDAGTWQPYEPLTTAPCGRPGQDTCPTAAGNLPALPGTGVVGGLLESVGELLGGLLSLSSLEDGELAARWARVRIEMDRLGRDKPAASPAPGALSDEQRLAVRERVQRLATGVAGLREGFPNAISNALLLTAEHSASGRPLAVFGPQTSYFVPQLLLEMSVHGGDINTRGMTFTGLPYVVIGRGPDFAWSATSGSSDLTDVRVVSLCQPADPPAHGEGGYRMNGQCQPFDVIEESWPARWNLAVPTDDPASVGQNFAVHRRVIRTAEYGPVIGFAAAGGQPVALTRQRSTYFAELDTALPFMQATRNDVHDVSSFQRVFNNTTGSFNWFYIDDRDIAFFHSGLYPQRAPGVHPELPSWGNGRYDWQGFLPLDAHPNDANPARGYLASWNNRPARDWWAADANASYGPTHRNDMLEVRLRDLVDQGGVTLANLVEAMGDAAVVDLRGQEVLPRALDLLETTPVTGDEASAIELMRDWIAGGAFRRDRDGDGDYDAEAAVALMDAWYPRMIEALLPQLTAMEDVNGRNLSLMGRDNKPGGMGSAYQSGYYGYLERVLEQALGTSEAPYRALRCADSDQAESCRQALARSLGQALDDLGGLASLDSWEVDESADNIQHRAIGLSSVPGIHWQNRPTFQQVVEFTNHR